MKRLEGKVAIITGAAGDIGRAITAAFVGEGARTVCLDRDLAGANACANDAGGTAAKLASAYECDVADSSSVSDTVQDIHRRFSRIDVLVNNAAVVSPYEPLHQLEERAWREALDVNLTGAFLVSKFAIPAMLDAGGGSIINVASQMGHVGAPGRAAYGATKAALIHLTRIMALDYARQGIRVNSISPGAVMTSRVVARYGSEDAVRAKLQPLYPLNRIGTPQDVAAAAVFLASSDASFITGTDLLVDGGYTAQ